METINPAVNYQRPLPGEHVRTSHPLDDTLLSKLDHRDIRIVSAGVHKDFGPYLCTVCTTSQGVVHSTTYADGTGLYPQFRPIAPTGPYADAIQQEHWRLGYSDDLEFTESSERYGNPSTAYLAGRAEGRVLRDLLGLQPVRVFSTNYESRLNTRRFMTEAARADAERVSKELRRQSAIRSRANHKAKLLAAGPLSFEERIERADKYNTECWLKRGVA